MPPGRCGDGSDAQVRLTYRLDDGAERISEATATDRYGALGLFLDRDCAQQVLDEAATLEIGEPRVVGAGRASVFELPVSLIPTGERDDVSFAGFEDTVLFRNTGSVDRRRQRADVPARRRRPTGRAPAPAGPDALRPACARRGQGGHPHRRPDSSPGARLGGLLLPAHR